MNLPQIPGMPAQRWVTPTITYRVDLANRRGVDSLRLTLLQNMGERIGPYSFMPQGTRIDVMPRVPGGWGPSEAPTTNRIEYRGDPKADPRIACACGWQGRISRLKWTGGNDWGCPKCSRKFDVISTPFGRSPHP